MTIENVQVIGGGAWGTALAQAAALAGRKVLLSLRDPDQADAINRTRCNSAYLGDVSLSDRISAVAGFNGLIGAHCVILAVPAQASRSVLSQIGDDLAGKPVILTAKGFETGTLKTQSAILSELAPDAIPTVLSGPSFAVDVAAGRPTAVTLAGADPSRTDALAQALASASFRPYASSDITGVELAGGLKNVYALGCGAIEGAGLGLSARSSFLARAFAEMTRLTVGLGGDAATITGLAGIGDLTLSCTSPQSRNYRYGLMLGKGLGPEQAAAQGVGLAEGVMTAPVALDMAKRAGVEVPLVAAVDLLLSGSARIEDIVEGLMRRPLKREGDDS